MNKTYILFLLLIVLVSNTGTIDAQTLRETEQRTIEINGSVSGQTLHVFNIQGEVNVERHNNNRVEIEIHKEFRAGTEARVRQLAEELVVRSVQEDNHILIYLEAPFIETKVNTANGEYAVSYDSDEQTDRIRYLLDFTIKVPEEMSLDLSTINEGQVYVRGTTGFISASNINGSIQLEDISGSVDASTINGEISARFSMQPGSDSSFRTINGNINTWFPPDLSSEVHFNSMHGDLFTDFGNLSMMPVAVSTQSSENGNTNRFQIGKNTSIRIGDGGNTVTFEIINGNAYIRERN